MAISNFIPIVWSDKIFQANESAKVFAQLTNRRYEGEISQKGDQVKIVEMGDITTNDYTGTVTYEELSDSAKVLLIDQNKYAAFQLDDIDKVQADNDLLTEATRKMGVSLAQAEDTHIAGLYLGAGNTIGTTGVPISITSSNVTTYISQMVVALDENNVPVENRVAVVPPWFAQKMTLAKITKDTDNSEVLMNGYVGTYLSIKFFMSNNVIKSGTTWYAPMFFTQGDTLAHANQLTTVEALRLETKLADGVRGNMVYGSKVVRPSSLGVLYCAAGAES